MKDAHHAWLLSIGGCAVCMGCAGGGAQPIAGAPPAPADVAAGQTAAPSADGGVDPVAAVDSPIDAGAPAVGATVPVQLDAVPMIGPKGSLEGLCRAWEQACPVRPRYDRPSLCSCKPEGMKATGKPVAPVLDAAVVWTARPAETGRYHIGLRPALRTDAGWFMAKDGPELGPEEQRRYMRLTAIEHRAWVVFRFREAPRPTDGGRGTMIADRHGAMICATGSSATPSCLDPIYGPSAAASPPALMADAQGRLLVGSPGAVIVHGSGHPERRAERLLDDAHPVRFP
ncbi:MAG: hypothetical protein QM820_22285 [Minicystis sp.]